MVLALAFALALQADPIVGRASVIDGDTLEIRGQRIRLWGIDAPERGQTCERGGETYRCGTEAARLLDQALADRTVTCTPRGRPDRYGLMVAGCTYQTTPEGGVIVGIQDVGGYMITMGYAVDYPRYSDGFYGPSQRSSQRRRVGLWAGEFQMPWEWRRERGVSPSRSWGRSCHLNSRWAARSLRYESTWFASLAPSLPCFT